MSAGVLWVLVWDVETEGPKEKVRDLEVGRVVEEEDAFLVVPGGLDRFVNSRFGSVGEREGEHRRQRYVWKLSMLAESVELSDATEGPG